MKPSKYEQQDKKLSLIKAGVGLLVITVVGKLALFVLEILLANKLQPNAYGIVAILLSISQIVMIFSNFGVSNTFIRFIPPGIEQHDYRIVIGVVKYGLAIASFTSLIVLALSSSLIYFYPQYSYPDIDRQFVVCGVVLGVVISYSKIIGAYFQSVGNPVLGHAYAENLYPIVSVFLLTMVIVFTTINWMVAMYCLLSAAVAVLAFGAFSMVVNLRRSSKSFDVTTCENNDALDYASCQRYAFNGLLIAIGFLGLRVTDKLMLGAMTTMQDVGIYALSNRLSLIILFVVFLFPPILGPYLSRHYGDKTNRALNAYLITSRWTYLITIPILLSLFFYSEQVLVLLGGTEYAGGSAVLKLLTVSSFLVAATGNNGLLLQMSGKEKIDRNNVMIALALDIILNYVLIPDYHVVGAAMATFIALSLTQIFKTYQVWCYWKVIPFGTGQVKGFLAGAVWIATFYLIGYFEVHFVIGAIVCGFVYLIALFSLGLTPDDKNIVNMIAMKARRSQV